MCTHMCMCVCVGPSMHVYGTCVEVRAQPQQKPVGLHLVPYLRQGLLFAITYASSLFGKSLISASPLTLEVLALQICTTVSRFRWVPGCLSSGFQASMTSALYSLNHLLSLRKIFSVP